MLSLINPTSEIDAGAQRREGDRPPPPTKRDKATEEKERFKFHRKANWKFPQETKRSISERRPSVHKTKTRRKCHGCF